MATNDIEIRLSVSGTQQAEKQMEKVEKASINLGESAKGVGETFSSVGEAIDKSGGLMGSGFAAIGDSVMAVTESVSGMKEAFALAGETGGKAWLSLLGPLALAVSAIGAVIEAFREFSGAAREAEMWEEAASATASDLTSRMEALAEEGIIPATAELSNFVRENQRARYALELLGLKNETLGKLYKQEAQLLEDLTQAKKSLNSIETQQAQTGKVLEKTFVEQLKLFPTLVKQLWEMDDATDTLSESSDTLTTITEKLKKAELDLAKSYEEDVIPKLQAALKAQTVATKTQLQLDDELYAKLKEIESLELERLDLQGKSKQAIEKVGTATKTLTLEQEKRRAKEKELQTQLKQNIITQEQYDASLIALKGDTYELTKSLDDQIEALNRELRVYQDADEKKKRLSEGSSDREEKAFNRRIELLNREKEIQSSALTQEALASTRKKNMVLREIADIKLLTQEEETRQKNLLKALGFELRTTEKEKKGREQLQKDLQEIDKKILDEQLAYALKTEARLKVDMGKLSNDALGYLDTLLKTTKKGNRQALATIVEDFKFHYSKLETQSKKAITEQIITEMENASARNRANKDFLLAREKENFDFSIREKLLQQKLRQQDLASLTATESSKIQILTNTFLVEKDLLTQRQARQRQELLDRLKIAQEDFDKNAKILAEKRKIGVEQNSDDSIEQYNRSIEIREQFYKELNLLDREHESQQRDFYLKEQQLKVEASVFDRKFRSEQLDTLQSFFMEDNDLRKEAINQLKEQELATALAIKNTIQPIVDGLDKQIQESVKDVEEAKKKVNALASLRYVPIDPSKTEEQQSLFEKVSEMMDLYKGLTKEQEQQLREQEYVLKDELDILNLYLQKKEALIGDSNTRIAMMQEEARQREIEENRTTMMAIASELKDMYITQIQSIASGLSNIFYDESTDQKLKELEANRQASMEQYKGDMKARAEIDKQYILQKRQIEAEDANMVSNLLKQTLRAVAQEALVKSIYHTGLGIGALAMGPFGGMSAAGHFKAAGVFAGLAAIAGMSSKAVGSGSSASASTSLSPTGASQTTTSPIREEAKQTEPIVFNINLSGSTIYDTRQAAEQAMANRVMSLAQRASRGQSNPFTR